MTDIWQQRVGQQWNAAPEVVRQAVDDYLVQYLRCKVREHRFGFQLVSITQGTHSTIRICLSGLKLFYRVMKQQGYYPFANPLVDPISTLYMTGEEQMDEPDEYPRLPDSSGVEKPRHKQRLSDSYFKLEGETWIPQVIDDPTLPGKLLTGGHMIGWNLREECVLRILFESGCRVSEAVGLTPGDWLARGILQEATAFSKGSHGACVKFLRFSNDTARLLRRYFDEERRRYDPDERTLANYMQLAQRHQVDTNTVPLFLSTRGTPLSARTFRENFWNPAWTAAGIDADIHQSRHWTVNHFVRSFVRTMTTYWFTSRSPEVEHQHPYLVFDSQDRLHLPLTIFGKAISQRLAPKTVQTYLYAILPWFSYLESDIWQCGNQPPRGGVSHASRTTTTPAYCASGSLALALSSSDLCALDWLGWLCHTQPRNR